MSAGNFTAALAQHYREHPAALLHDLRQDRQWHYEAREAEAGSGLLIPTRQGKSVELPVRGWFIVRTARVKPGITIIEAVLCIGLTEAQATAMARAFNLPGRPMGAFSPA